MIATILFIVKLLYIGLIIYYSGLMILSILLMIRQVIVRFLLKRRFPDKTIESDFTLPKGVSLSKRITFLFQTDHVINDVVAIGSVILAFVLLSVVPLELELKLTILPFIASIFPYVWGFTRSTGVGVHSGVFGAVLGLIYFAYATNNLVWWEQAPYFFALTIVANVSGWLGGFVGIGQIKEAVVANYFVLSIGKHKSSLSDVIAEIRGVVDRVIEEHTTGKLEVLDRKPNFITAQAGQNIGNHFSLISLRHEIEWRRGIRPQLMLLGWLFEKNLRVFTTNDILDNAFNLWRHTVAKVVFLHDADSLKSGDTKINLLIAVYKETPSIIWADKETEDLSNMLHTEICQSDNVTEKTNCKIVEKSNMILRNWQPKLRLEQYFKNTRAAREKDSFFLEKQIEGQIIPTPLIEEFSEMKTFFDKIRGRSFTFLAFLISQIGLGVLVNWLSEIFIF